MSSLVPCTQCRRHVQRGGPACPFCGAALGAPLLGRQVPVPKDAKRATLFAIGVSLVAACEGDTVTIPIYGAPAPPMSQGGSAGSGSGGNGGAVPVAGSGGAGGNVGNPQPVYGAPVPPGQGGNAGTESIPPDAGDGSDAGDASPS